MAQIIKIAITGGPCAGKTTAVKFLADKLKKYGIGVYTVEEQATKLMLEGKTPENMGIFEFHKLLFERSLADEIQAEKRAENDNHEKAVILFDRGLLDCRAYISGEDFEKYASLYNINEEIIRNRYDAVFHLVTAADGAEDFYNKKTNIIRRENIEQAVLQDRKTLAVWVGTTHLRIIDNSTDFENKLNRLLEEVLAVLGIPQPLEIEKKFLIEYPNLEFLNSLDTCRKIPITQAYLTTPEEGNFRVRKRGHGKNALYIKTVKIKISDMKRIETETYISKDEYNSYISDKEHVTGIISKDRYCIAYESSYFELDVYPFWNDKATMEIELLKEDQKYKLPPFVKIIEDVTAKREYSNLILAQKYGKL